MEECNFKEEFEKEKHCKLIHMYKSDWLSKSWCPGEDNCFLFQMYKKLEA